MGLFDSLGSAIGLGGPAVVGTGLALGSSLIGADAAKKAARIQADAANRAADLQMQQFLQTREDFAPWRETGARALGQLEGNLPELTRRFSLSDFEVDPGYFFRLSEGQKAIDRAAAARGRWNAPATAMALSRFNQDLASQEFGNAFNRFNLGQTNEYNRLAGLAGTGQTAVSQLGQLGQQNVNSLANLLTSGAAAQASGRMGVANAITGGIGQGLNFYNQQALLAALGAPTMGGGTLPSFPLGDYPSLEAAIG